jgi:hypothetical protein
MGLFYFFGGDGTDRAGLGGCCIPRRWFHAPFSAPGRSAHHRQQGRPCQMQGRPRRDDRTGCGALDCLRNVSDRARPNGQKNKTYKYVVMLRAQLDKNVNIRYNIGIT